MLVLYEHFVIRWHIALTVQVVEVVFSSLLNIVFSPVLTGYNTPNQKYACVVLYLNIINTFLETQWCEFYSKLSKELKSSIKI